MANISKGTIKYVVEPYEVAASKQEQNNYLLCSDCDTGKVRSFRISRMKNVFLLAEKFAPQDDIMKKIHVAVKKGPQFSFDSIEKSCVILSDEGKRKYKMIYTNRPIVEKVDGDKYYFEWPLVQLEEYFKRFGKDAVIIFPQIAKNNLRSFYEQASNVYADN
ncbi:WYL domain-containing protein [Butyrivibrio sp. AC2005]|uniref:WYL domain-containing protein n=1 Tax=Butyrivibrio sp. AC2005 TaxID=1280672 RepID=UPI0006775B36|nr:WYL domain-containing protein [Butyrivibrio sp. AC2005]